MSKSEIIKKIAKEKGIQVIDYPIISRDEAEEAFLAYLQANQLPTTTPSRKRNGKYLPKNKYQWKNKTHPSWVKWRHLRKAFYNMTRGASQSDFQRKLAKECMFIV